MALGPDFRPAEESNTGGFRPLLLAPPHFNPTPTSIWAKVRGEELSSTIDSGGESASFYEALTGARASCSSRLDWCDLRCWSRCPLQPLQSHCHHCITAGHQPARNGQAHDPHFPKDNFATLCNSFAKPPPRLLCHEKYTSSGRDQSCCQRRGEGLGWQE